MAKNVFISVFGVIVVLSLIISSPDFPERYQAAVLKIFAANNDTAPVSASEQVQPTSDPMIRLIRDLSARIRRIEDTLGISTVPVTEFSQSGSTNQRSVSADGYDVPQPNGGTIKCYENAKGDFCACMTVCTPGTGRGATPNEPPGTIKWTPDKNGTPKRTYKTGGHPSECNEGVATYVPALNGPSNKKADRCEDVQLWKQAGGGN